MFTLGANGTEYVVSPPFPKYDGNDIKVAEENSGISVRVMRYHEALMTDHADYSNIKYYGMLSADGKKIEGVFYFDGPDTNYDGFVDFRISEKWTAIHQ